MSMTEKHRNRLITLLKELFQLDQPELDFGLYKIMHAKSVQITKFLESDLLKEIELAFGEKDSVNASQMKAQAIAKLKESLGDEALDDNGNLQDAFRKIPAGKKYLEEIAAAEAAEAAKDTLNAESEIYDHLYRFFERYYDNGDFMSRRYYARESDSRAAPFSVPYDGREVYLHWANKDQYYIKSSEYLTNYTFELNEAVRQEAERQKGQKGKGDSFDFGAAISDTLLRVHCRIVDASEGEHGNIKAAGDLKRFFIIHADAPVSVESGELVMQFQYRTDSEKTGQDNTWQQTRLQQAESAILQALQAEKSAALFLQGLQLPAPTDSKDKRTLLGKYLQKYAARNTMDYFIHKDLGGFMRRELDFYIKNEIMRLDDIENAEAPKVEQYLSRIRVLRRIAHQLIAFLAQLEDFQKKLWLKKKFVTETHYCITLDRVPEGFHAEIAANDRQREEWVKLFAIDEIAGTEKQELFGSGTVAYSVPLTVAFLQANPYLLLDTALFSDDFKQRLLAEIPDLDAQCDGVLVHSENFQALGLMQEKYREQVKCIYIDPPYNTDAGPISYKNGYRSSSWASMMLDRLSVSKQYLRADGILCATIDDYQQKELHYLLAEIFGAEQMAGTVSIRINPSGRPVPSGFAQAHEYAIFARMSETACIQKLERTAAQMQRYKEADKDGSYMWELFRKRGSNSERHARPSLYYPIFVKGKSLRVPEMAWDDKARVWAASEEPKSDEVVFFPIDDFGTERTWRWKPESIKDDPTQFCVKNRDGKFVVYYKFRPSNDGVLPLTFWGDAKYSATEHGTGTLKNLFSGPLPFSYPKSIYAVEDCIGISGMSSDSTLCLDYFGGSATSGHAVINLNREDNGKRKYILVEQNNYFDTVLKPRIQKVIYSKDWKDGKPVSREGISHCFKTLRLESYEDALNNLALKPDSSRDTALANNPAMQRDYLLNYFLDVETSGSQSLLNIADFRDPTAYQMQIKKPGSEEQTLQSIDLVETFNWLIGLWVQHMGAPHSFSAEFEREKDADLPKDQNTRLLCKRLKPDASGVYWFRLIEGYTLKVPGDDTSKVPTLIVWRKQSDDAEKDNAVLQKFLMEKLQISPREQTYGVIYINGSHTLPNPVVEGEQTKVRLIEEAFHNAMWAGEAS